MTSEKLDLTPPKVEPHSSIREEVTQILRDDGISVSAEIVEALTKIAYRHRQGGVVLGYLNNEAKRFTIDQIGEAIEAEKVIRSAAKMLADAVKAAPAGVQSDLVRHLESADIPVVTFEALIALLIDFGEHEQIGKPHKKPGKVKAATTWNIEACWRLLGDACGSRVGSRAISRILPGVSTGQAKGVHKGMVETAARDNDLGGINILGACQEFCV